MQVAVKFDQHNQSLVASFSIIEEETVIVPIGFDALWAQAQWNNYVASRQGAVQQKYTLGEIEAMFLAFQEKDFNASAIIYLTSKVEPKVVKELERLNIPENLWIDSSLPYAMIKAIEVYILKVWAKYNLYRLQLLDNQFVDEVDFATIGEPPCWRGDVEWVVSESYRALQPDRFANTPEKLTTQYYKDYINNS